MLTFITNGSILVLLILIPLIYPEALPKAAMQTALSLRPAAAAAAAAAAAGEVKVVHVQSEMMNNQLTAPTRIPHDIKMVAEKEAPPIAGFGVAGMEGLGGSGAA